MGRKHRLGFNHARISLADVGRDLLWVNRFGESARLTLEIAAGLTIFTFLNVAPRHPGPAASKFQ